MPLRMNRRQFVSSLSATAAAAALSSPAIAQAGTVKIAQLEILSGGFAVLGETNARSIEVGIEEFNARAGQGPKLEVQLFDSKGSAQEAQTIFAQVADQGVRYVTGGGTSAVVGSLIDAIARHNERNPGKEILYLNHQAIDPDFTNARCNFWHFRFDPHVFMRMDAMTRFLAADRSVQNVFLINQDYAFGQQVQNSAKEQLAAKRPDVKIVGEELHPIGRVRDFSPFVAKIRASGADTIITGNFGSDLVLLIRAANDAGLNVKFYTYYANALGAPTALGEAGIGRTRLVTGMDLNALNPRMTAIHKRFKEKYPKLELFHAAYFDMLDMMGAAFRKAGSAEPLQVARAMEGMTIDGAFGPVTMRADDHQMLAPLFVQTFDKVDGVSVKVGVDGLNLGFRTDAKYMSADTTLPHSCIMRRPS
jgi:branched-chain amino acid transport system substrate-binding protein